MAEARNYEQYRRQILDNLGVEYYDEDIHDFDRWKRLVLETLIGLFPQRDVADAVDRWLTEHKDDIRIPDETITANKIVNGAVESDKISDGAVTLDKLGGDVEDEINSAKYRDNLLDSLNLVPYAQNILIEDNGVHLTYRDDIDTYFQLKLHTPVRKGKTYTLSFDCEGLPDGVEVSFSINNSSGSLFSLHNGRVTTTFTMTADNTASILLDDNNRAGNRPHDTNIRLTNFLLEEGSIASNYKPSMGSVADSVKKLSDGNISYTTSNEWFAGLVDGKHLTASRNVIKTFEKDPSFALTSGAVVSKPVYTSFPMPMKQTSLSGTCDSLGASIINVNGIAPSGEGATGAVFRGLLPYDRETWQATVRMQIIGIRADVPESPTVGYDSSIGDQIVDVAKSYTNAYDRGRRYYYGKNLFYLNNDTVNDSQGRGVMECDTFAGLCLRGIRYEDSPYASSGSNIYANDEPNKKMTYEQMMQNTESPSLPTWAVALRSMFVSDIMQNLLNHEVRFAADDARMFWTVKGHIFSDVSQARAGDVAFWRTNGKPYFDGTTHVAIVGDNDDIYEVTGFQRSNGRYLHNIKFENLVDHMPDYFARPYGFTE